MKQFKRILLALMSAVIFFSAIALFPVSLKPLRSIGDSREDYTFFAINDAAVSAKKDIFVLDVKGIFIAKYDWSGKFIKKIGRKGQGPGDLNFPNGLDIYDNTLLIADSMNKRLFICSENLDNYQYYPMPSLSTLSGKCYFSDSKTFLGIFAHMKKDMNRIAVFNESGKILHHFFNEYPIKLDVDPVELSEKGSGDIKSGMRGFMIGIETKPILGIDNKRGQILVSFHNPDNPILFFVYAPDGRLIRKFSHSLDKKYRFFDLYTKVKDSSDLDIKKYPDLYFQPKIKFLAIYKTYYLAELQLCEFHKKDLAAYRQSIIVFNSDGSYRGEAVLEEEENFLGIFDDDVALTVKYEEDNTVLRIQKLVF